MISYILAREGEERMCSGKFASITFYQRQITASIHIRACHISKSLDDLMVQVSHHTALRNLNSPSTALDDRPKDSLPSSSYTFLSPPKGVHPKLKGLGGGETVEVDGRTRSARTWLAGYCSVGVGHVCSGTAA